MADIFRTSPTDIGKVDRLLSFIQDNVFLFGFGQDEEWTNDYGVGVDDENPPVISRAATSIYNPTFYKKADQILPVVKSDCGVFSMSSCTDISPTTKWTLLPIDTEGEIETVYAVKPTNIYLSVTISPEDRTLLGLTEIQYRTVGLYRKPIFNSGVDLNKSLYLVSEIQDPGILYWYSNHTPQVFSATDCSTVKIIINQ
jgi:hypothetical protein